MGYKPSKADYDLWMKPVGDHYDYIARYVDNVIVFSKDPLAVIEELKKIYVMKDIGKPRYYLGGDIVELGPEWQKEGVTEFFSAETYIHNAIPRLAKSCGVTEFKHARTPFAEEYHAELDKSELFSPHQISVYKSLLGSANWIITLGRFDIVYATNTLYRYSMAPREGHMTALHRVFGYLKQNSKGRLMIDIGSPPVRDIIATNDELD